MGFVDPNLSYLKKGGQRPHDLKKRGERRKKKKTSKHYVASVSSCIYAIYFHEVLQCVPLY
jgi:hypothetical protein